MTLTNPPPMDSDLVAVTKLRHNDEPLARITVQLDQLEGFDATLRDGELTLTSSAPEAWGDLARGAREALDAARTPHAVKVYRDDGFVQVLDVEGGVTVHLDFTPETEDEVCSRAWAIAKHLTMAYLAGREVAG